MFSTNKTLWAVVAALLVSLCTIRAKVCYYSCSPAKGCAIPEGDQSDCTSYRMGGVSIPNEKTSVTKGTFKWTNKNDCPGDSDKCCDSEPVPLPRDCYEVQQNGETASGIYTVSPNGSHPFDVYCDMDTDGGGWTVFQRRADGSVDFYRDWASYVGGFGSLDGEHWLGNDKLFYLTIQKPNLIRVDLEDFDGATRYAVYDSFYIADSTDNYRLSLGAYSGEAGDAMASDNGQRYSTKDQDHDTWDSNCAVTFRGAWWYHDCHAANLNGQYLGGERTKPMQSV